MNISNASEIPYVKFSECLEAPLYNTIDEFIINEFKFDSRIKENESNIQIERIDTGENTIQMDNLTGNIKGLEQNEKFNAIKENENTTATKINEDLTKNLNIDEILKQKYGSSTDKKLKTRTDEEKFRVCANNIFELKLSKQAKLAKERQVVQRFNNLSAKEKERKKFSAYESFSKSCQNFIHKSFVTGQVDLESKKVFYKTPSATLCVFLGFDLAQIFKDDITFNVELQYYEDLPNFTNVLIGMNKVYRKLIEITEKRKKIMEKKGFLKK